MDLINQIMKSLIYLLIIFTFSSFRSKKLSKATLKRTITIRGWLNKNQRVDYWFYYFENGNKKKKKVHYANKKISGGFFTNQIRKSIKNLKTIN
jgi:hypothetical protein